MANAPGPRTRGALNPVSRTVVVGHSPDTVRPNYLDRPTRFNRRLNIHRRKVIPELPAGELVGDAQPTPPLALGASSPAAMAAAATGAAALAPAPPQLRLHYNQQINDIA